MAAGPGRNLPDVIRGILHSAASHDFTQVAYLLEQHWPERGKIGDGLDRWCRFRPASETSFPAADIRRCDYDTQGRLDIQLNFMGFYGVDAAVPHYFTDRAMQDDDGGRALRAFLDTFNHRLYALYYQAWKKYRPTFHVDEPANLYMRMISAFSGWSVSDDQGSALAYAGLLGRRVRNAQSLEGLLNDYLEAIPVKVRQFQSRWVRVKRSRPLGDGSLRLGDNLLLGEEVLDISGKIDVMIGPVSPQASMQLMPSTSKGRAVIDLVARYLPPSIDFDLVIQITSGSVEAESLGSDQLVLGWSTWLQDRVTADWQARISGSQGVAPAMERSKAA
ncbi:MAG: type VI secretion system baseplate subunit TssG [Candidatus Thiodiazotropha sp. (ex Monitilora ramsayi)]|nr:type VI secretion system baseplate subunit TssG [Candidatus Thiodiazotropha sp. (ex Monitilora ramsayi)]